ncbi:histone promoter control 2 [Phlyctema vagabunda]|uniref:Histone promoter control 2 n=1 Tax=Phlyctema vagabunda TaxID=108571 RepID=A0ABR4PSB8_9HELO
MSAASDLRHEEMGEETPTSRQYSSSPGLSSPPRSSPEAPDSAPKSRTGASSSSRLSSSITVGPVGVEGSPATSSSAPPVKERKKPGRKPKIHYNPDGSIMDVPVKVRKARKPKDPNAPAPIPRKRKSTTTTTTSTSDAALNLPDGRSASGRQPRMGDADVPPPENHFLVPSNASVASQNGNKEGIPIASFFNITVPPQTNPPPPQPQPQSQSHPARTSGQNYDPIRSNYDPVRETVIAHNAYTTSQGSPQAPYAPNRASESPSISSLVDPPNQTMTSPSVATQSFFNQQHQQQQQARLSTDGRTSIPASPIINRHAPSPAVQVEAREYYKSPAPPAAAPVPTSTLRKDVPVATPAGPAGPAAASNKKSTTSSAGASPKPHKTKEKFPTPPPLPGSGIMQLGGTDGTEFRAPTICIEVKINPGEGNKYVNFNRMAEERYGWDALHPRLAAQRERLARVAAAGAALERNGNKESGDEASDDSDSENDVDMGGMSDGRMGTDTGEKRIVKKRMMKEDMYDKDDGFVDDSEMQWEEQAVAANDGFFVYSGPLVPEVAKPDVDSAPKRGRGRGRGGTGRGGGPGSRGGRVPGAPSSANGSATGTRPATGPGSRGGAITRKPRITKADRARMEQEKLDREKMGTLASMPSGYSGMTLPSNIGTTPMVFNQ